MTAKGVKCPLCNMCHSLNYPDVTQLAQNVTIFEILKETLPVSAPSELLCEACSQNIATVICIDCQPDATFKFCSGCDYKEHNRNFDPVRSHRRVPISDPTFACCSHHQGNKAVFFSKELHEFACEVCESDSDWQYRQKSYEEISDCAQKLRKHLQLLNQSSRDIVGKLTVSKEKLVQITSELGPSAANTKAQIRDTFAEIIQQIQTRRMNLLKYVEEEVCFCFDLVLS